MLLPIINGFFQPNQQDHKKQLKNLSYMFQNFGNPVILVSDRGTAFTRISNFPKTP